MSPDKAVFAAVDVDPAPHQDCAACKQADRILADITANPSAWWSLLSPAQALALLKAAPKVAGPWRIIRHGEVPHDPAYGGKPVPLSYERKTPHGIHVTHVYATIVEQRGRMWFAPQCDAYFETASEAMTATDETIRAAGWVLDDGA